LAETSSRTCHLPVTFSHEGPGLAIARYVRSRDGAAHSHEILERFRIGQSTLRRRRPEPARLGIVFVEDGNRSLYAKSKTTEPGESQRTRVDRFVRTPEGPARGGKATALGLPYLCGTFTVGAWLSSRTSWTASSL
jgi:hypothetical protein